MGTHGGTRRLTFGNLAVVVFLVAQALDGILTYVGVATYGAQAEGNPFIGWLMASVGQVAGLATAKVAAGFFGVVLHLAAVHRAVAALAAFYLAAAVLPWIVVLFVVR